MNAPADANASRGNICVVWGWVAAFVWSGWLVLAAVVTADTFRQQVKRGREAAAPTAPVGRPKMCGFSLTSQLSSSPARRAYRRHVGGLGDTSCRHFVSPAESASPPRPR